MSGSLAQAAGYVTDAFKIFAEATFRPEDIGVGEFTFLPWVRNGLAAQLTPPSGNALRATVAVSVKVQDENGNSKPVQKQLTLRGPGDVIGIDSAQIVRRVPRAGTVNAEESFLVHVEFDRPELPWLFTPLRPSNDRLQPWLVLVVCDAKVTQLEPGPPGFPQRLRTKLGELQPLDNCWAFAHAQDRWHRHFSHAGPLGGIWDALVHWTPSGAAVNHAVAVNAEDFAFLVVFVALAVVVWRHFGAAYGLFAAVSLAIPLSFPSSRWPLLSLPRFGLVIFPFFLALAAVTTGRPRLHAGLVVCSSFLLGILVVQWALWQWVA